MWESVPEISEVGLGLGLGLVDSNFDEEWLFNSDETATYVEVEDLEDNSEPAEVGSNIDLVALVDIDKTSDVLDKESISDVVGLEDDNSEVDGEELIKADEMELKVEWDSIFEKLEVEVVLGVAQVGLLKSEEIVAEVEVE